jgi:hypothetical protein
LATEAVWSLDNWLQVAPVTSRLRALLTPQAQLDLYVCDLAAGPEGQAFVSALAAWTGASVRASTDPVGSGALGDFDWEFSAGAASAPRGDLLSPDALEETAGLVLHDDNYEPGLDLGR